MLLPKAALLGFLSIPSNQLKRIGEAPNFQEQMVKAKWYPDGVPLRVSWNLPLSEQDKLDHILKPPQDVMMKCKTKYNAKELLNEQQILDAIQGPFTPLLGVSQGCLVFPSYDVDLFTYISHGKHSFKEKRQIAIGMVKAVKALHDLGYTHHDITPSHFYLKRNEAEERVDVVLADFGHTSHSDESFKMTGGSIMYAPPEVRYDRQLNAQVESSVKADVWSLGVCMYVLLTGKHPLEWVGLALKEDENILQHQDTRVVLALDDVPKGHLLMPLFKRMLSRDPAKRLQDLNLVLAHPWFRE